MPRDLDDDDKRKRGDAPPELSGGQQTAPGAPYPAASSPTALAHAALSQAGTAATSEAALAAAQAPDTPPASSQDPGPEPLTHEDRWAALEAANKAELDRQVEAGLISRDESLYEQRRFDNENLVRESTVRENLVRENLATENAKLPPGQEELNGASKGEDNTADEKPADQAAEHSSGEQADDPYAPASSRKAEAAATQASDPATEVTDAKADRLARLRELKTAAAERAALNLEHARDTPSRGRGF